MSINEFVLTYNAFIFDFDGVLVDSLPIKSEAFAQLFVDLGVDVMEKVKEYHLSNGGVSRYEKFKYFYQTFRGKEITAEESAQLDRQFSQLVVRAVIEAKPIDGAMSFLKVISESSKFAGVVSATPQAEIRHIVQERELEKYFQEVLGSPVSKKDNVGLLLKKYKLIAEQTVFFGDAKSDYEAAREHNINFIGVVNGPDSELGSIKGIKTIKDFNV